MQITNVKPLKLSPFYDSKVTGPFAIDSAMTSVLCKDIRTPIFPGAPVSLKDDNGSDITDNKVVAKVTDCLGIQVDMRAENWVKEFYGQTAMTFNRNTKLGMRQLFAIQSATAAKMQEPGPLCIYDAGRDVIPVSRKFLSGNCDYDEYFATMAFFAKVQTLGVYFATENCFDMFKTYVANYTANLVNLPTVPSNTMQMLSDFQTLQLNQLTESLRIRNNTSDNNDEYSFARVIVNIIMEYAKTANPTEFGLLPFDLAELFCPTTLVFVNVEQHMRSSARQINIEWDIIQQSLQNPINMVSMSQLSKLTAAQRAIRKASAAAAATMNALGGAGRSASIVFRKMPPTPSELVRWVTKLCQKLGNVNKSENAYRQVKMTFNKPNRRDPDDFNKQGKSISQKFKPDLHIYLDTSGSITEDNYREAIMACIRIARRMNINLYFNSFSSVLSQCVKLKTKDKSTKQVYAEFQKVPKVGGGTDYEQIWHYINKSKKRKRELSLIITDFEWEPPNKLITHPKNLYYAPCSNMDWDQMRDMAKNFVELMQIIEPNIRNRVLM